LIDHRLYYSSLKNRGEEYQTAKVLLPKHISIVCQTITITTSKGIKYEICEGIFIKSVCIISDDVSLSSPNAPHKPQFRDDTALDNSLLIYTAKLTTCELADVSFVIGELRTTVPSINPVHLAQWL